MKKARKLKKLQEKLLRTIPEKKTVILGIETNKITSKALVASNGDDLKAQYFQVTSSKQCLF